MARMVHIDIPKEDLGPDVVRRAIAGTDPDIPPSVALSLLSDSDMPGTDPHALLQEAVENSDLEPHVRVAAVRVYMRAAGEGSAPGLLQALESSEEPLAAAAATALAQVGTPDHLDALERARGGKGGALLSDRAAWAEALIIHRFGLADREFDFPAAQMQPAPVATGALAFASVKPGPSRRDHALKAIKRDLPWFDPGKQDVYEVQCGPRLLEVAVDREVVTGGEKLAKPATPAVVAMQDLEYGDFYAGLIALSRPTGADRLRVELSRLTGEAVYVGEGSRKGGEVELDLRAADAAGVAPVAGRVRVTSKGVEISGVSDRRSAPKKSPQKAP